MKTKQQRKQLTHVRCQVCKKRSTILGKPTERYYCSDCKSYEKLIEKDMAKRKENEMEQLRRQKEANRKRAITKLSSIIPKWDLKKINIAYEIIGIFLLALLILAGVGVVLVIKYGILKLIG